MIVCIAEKPSVARDLAEILGAKNRKDGYLEGNGYAVTWVYGHLCSLKDPEDYLSSGSPCHLLVLGHCFFLFFALAWDKLGNF